jgi:hypothetical protein
VLNRFYIAGFACLTLLAAFLPGACVPEILGGKSPTKVSGKVLLDGQPVENAKVIFIPMKSLDVTGRVQHLSYGITDGQGNFTLKQADGDPGTMAGMQRVIISKRKAAGSPGKELDGAAIDLLIADGAVPFGQSPDEQLPIIYNRQSTLMFDIEETGKPVEADFDLSSVDPLISR